MKQFLYTTKQFLKNNTYQTVLVFILFLALTFPAYKALFHEGMFTSHDGEGHLIRLFEFDQALQDGHFPVRWSKRLNEGLGYPFFNYNYPFGYYLADTFHQVGFGLVESLKIIFILSFPLSGFFTFLWLKERFDSLSSIMGGLFFTIVPYHFLNIYVRGNLGEGISLTLVPLGFYLIERVNRKQSILNVIFLSFVLGGLILSHNIMAMVFLPIFIFYSTFLYRKTNIKGSLMIALSLLFGILLSSFFWLPALVEKNLVNLDVTFARYYADNFPTLKNLIYSPWGFGGSKVGVDRGEMSFQIGVLHEIFLLTSIIFLIKGFRHGFKKNFVLPIFFVVLTMFTLFLMQPQSLFIWDFIKPLQFIQFPWRLLSIIVVSISFLAAFSFSRLRRLIKNVKVYYLLVAIVSVGLFYLNRNHWKVNEYYNPPSYWFLDQPVKTTTTIDGEHRPKWQSKDLVPAQSRYELALGQADIKSTLWKTNYHVFKINAYTDSLILDRTVYFPGWIALVDGKKVETLDPENKNTKGLIGVSVPKGEHILEFKLEEPVLHKIVDAVSFLSFSSLILLFFFKVFLNLKSR